MVVVLIDIPGQLSSWLLRLDATNLMITMRGETGSEVSHVDWLPGGGGGGGRGVEEDGELVIVSVTKELGGDDIAEPLYEPGVLV